MALSHDLCYTVVDLCRLLEYHDLYTSVLQYFTFVMSIVICLVGLVGNAVVIWFLGFIMKKYKSRYWFLNLAITDFLALLTLPFRAISDLKGTWTFGPFMCKLYLFSFCVSMYAGVYILIVLNIARVLSVAKPMFHLKFMSQRVSLWICSLFWFIPILLTFPVFYNSDEVKIGEATLCTFIDNKTFGSIVNKKYNMSRENNTREVTFCDIYTKLSPYIDHCSPDTCCGGEGALEFWNYLISMTKAFVIPLLIIGYFLPLSAVIICNITIVAYVRKSKTTNTHKLYRLVLIIIMVYFITQTPLVIAEIMIHSAILNMNLISMFNVLTFMPLLTNIAYVNSCFNPIMYMLSGGQMRTRLSDFISNIRNRYK
ncbi:N-formyl peptide receptor 3-like [Dendropsophus ebraccatus]|uniref:N-formyl peptide receptor 3-like n=1 Tax=Dendropsophus ebraccatus TaxID=150705 RepID=UPI003831C09B